MLSQMSYDKLFQKKIRPDSPIPIFLPVKCARYQSIYRKDLNEAMFPEVLPWSLKHLSRYCVIIKLFMQWVEIRHWLTHPGENIKQKVRKLSKTGQDQKIWYLLLQKFWLLKPKIDFCRAKYLKIWAKKYKIWKYFEKGQVTACDYHTQ